MKSKLRQSIEQARSKVGTMAALALAIHIPKRTLEKWVTGERHPDSVKVVEILKRLESLK